MNRTTTKPNGSKPRHTPAARWNPNAKTPDGANGGEEQAGRPSLPKAATGIQGLDEVLSGGLPRGRPTLVAGAAGCGKTLLATQFLVNGAAAGEPGVLMSFDESARDIGLNTASLGINIERLIKRKQLAVDYVNIDRSALLETGEFDLDGLFIRLDLAIREIGARRVVLDGLDNLFAGFTNQAILRSEVRRLLQWLKDQDLTAIVTAERGVNTLTRNGLEEYLTDCVIALDHLVHNSLSTRRLRVVKYRGSTHGTNEYPFLIDRDGISVLPLTSIGLDHRASRKRISSGIPTLDEMLGGEGFYRGTSVLVAGTAGAGKTSIAAHFVDAACRRGERCTYFAFEESLGQISRNMESVGLDLEQWARAGLLQVHTARPTTYGLEMHLVSMHRAVREHRPTVVVIDPISSLAAAGTPLEVRSMLIRLFDWLKAEEITTLATSLTSDITHSGPAESSLSSVMDAWLMVRMIETGGERNRLLSVLKARGIAHSNQVREFLITNAGVRLVDAYVGTGEVLTGSARLAQQERERLAALAETDALEQQRRSIATRRQQMQEQIAALQTQLTADEAEIAQLEAARTTKRKVRQAAEAAMAAARHVRSDRQ